MAIYAEPLGAKPAPSFPQRFQKLKADTHRQLVEMIDLTKLGHWKQERLQKEVRRLAERMTVNTSELLNEADRERLVAEILDEIFGLGPLESLMKRPDGLRYSRQRAQPGFHRTLWPARARRTSSSPTTPT